MTIGHFGYGVIGTKQHQNLNIDFMEHTPTGQLNDINSDNIHLPFSRNEVIFNNKRNYPTVREMTGHTHSHDYKLYPLTQTNPSVSVFNDLYNYNPTQGISYFEPHATDKLIHHPKDKPRFEIENYKYNKIPDQIESNKKTSEFLVVNPDHSFTLNRSYRT